MRETEQSMSNKQAVHLIQFPKDLKSPNEGTWRYDRYTIVHHAVWRTNHTSKLHSRIIQIPFQPSSAHIITQPTTQWNDAANETILMFLSGTAFNCIRALGQNPQSTLRTYEYKIRKVILRYHHGVYNRKRMIKTTSQISVDNNVQLTLMENNMHYIAGYFR